MFPASKFLGDNVSD